MSVSRPLLPVPLTRPHSLSLSTLPDPRLLHLEPRGSEKARPRRPGRPFVTQGDSRPTPRSCGWERGVGLVAPRASREWRSVAARPGHRLYAQLRHRTLMPSLVAFLLPILWSPGHTPGISPSEHLDHVVQRDDVRSRDRDAGAVPVCSVLNHVVQRWGRADLGRAVAHDHFDGIRPRHSGGSASPV
jgi:hypothetical protein